MDRSERSPWPESAIYVVTNDGELLRHVFDFAKKAFTTPPQGEWLADDWHRYRSVHAAGNGALLATDAEGQLWHHDTRAPSKLALVPRQGKQIGSGFIDYRDLFVTANGRIYLSRRDGTLHAYSVDPGTLAVAMHGQIGSGFQFRKCVAGPGGKVFAIDSAGKVRVYTHWPDFRWLDGNGQELPGLSLQEAEHVAYAKDESLWVLDRGGSLSLTQVIDPADSVPDVARGWAPLRYRIPRKQLGWAAGRDRPLRGRRPMVVVVVDYVNSLGAVMTDEDVSRIELLTRTKGALPHPNLHRYLQECSNGGLGLDRVAFTRIKRELLEGGEPQIRAPAILRAAAEDAAFLTALRTAARSASPVDQLNNEELALLVVERSNGAGHVGANRFVSATVADPELEIRCCAAFVAVDVSFHVIAHELLHSFGAIDLYRDGDDTYHANTSLMGQTVPRPGLRGEATSHLDGWHKFRFGWVNPAIRSVRVPGRQRISLRGTGGPDGSAAAPPAPTAGGHARELDSGENGAIAPGPLPVLELPRDPKSVGGLVLVDPGRGLDKRLHLEARSKKSTRWYEQLLRKDGVAVWREPGVHHMVEQLRLTGGTWARDLDLWSDVGTDIRDFRWLDGAPLGVRLELQAWDPVAGVAEVGWYDLSRPAVLYELLSGGELAVYEHFGSLALSSTGWAMPKPVPLPAGCSQITHLSAGDVGKLWVVTPNGNTHALWVLRAQGGVDGGYGGLAKLCDWVEVTPVRSLGAAPGGVAYLLMADGSLVWARLEPIGSNPSIKQSVIGKGLLESKSKGKALEDEPIAILPVDEGVLYLLTRDGALWWTRHWDHREGSPGMADLRLLGRGFEGFESMTSVGQGVFYARKDGALWAGRHEQWRVGAGGFDPADMRVVLNNWPRSRLVGRLA